MKYCYQCNRVTAGEPLFCNFCGRSYNVKLCPRMHSNPRKAQACSRCGSRDLSTPGPKLPWWTPLLEFALRLIPGGILIVGSVFAAILVLEALLQNPSLLASLIVPVLMLLILWWAWSQIPQWLREAIYRFLKGRRDGKDDRRGE